MPLKRTSSSKFESAVGSKWKSIGPISDDTPIVVGRGPQPGAVAYRPGPVALRFLVGLTPLDPVHLVFTMEPEKSFKVYHGLFSPGAPQATVIVSSGVVEKTLGFS